MEKYCLICDRIALIQKKENPYYVGTLHTGHIVLGDHKFFYGYTLFLCKLHKKELHELEPEFRRDFLWEMSKVAAAVFKAFQPRKLNYELLGNTDEHMHWHIFPRYDDDLEPTQSVWAIDKSVRCAETERPSKQELEVLKQALCKHLM